LTSAAEVDSQISDLLTLSGNAAVIVQLTDESIPGHSSPLRQSVIAARLDSVLRDLSAEDFTLVHRYRNAPGFSGVVTSTGLAKLRASRQVLAVRVNETLYAADANTNQMIGAGIVQQLGVKGRGQRIAILDSGVMANYAPLANRIVDQACFCFTNCCPGGRAQAFGPGTGIDPIANGHGTAVAAIAAANNSGGPYEGVSPEAEIVSVRLIHNEATTIGDVEAALDWLVDGHRGVNVVNLSIGGNPWAYPQPCDGQYALSRDLVAALKARGAVVVAASGNCGTLRSPYPACLPDVFTVASTYAVNHMTNVFHDFSFPPGACGPATPPWCIDFQPQRGSQSCRNDQGTFQDYFAPGEDITIPGGFGFSGSSAASPHVAGAAALLFQLRRSTSAASVNGLGATFVTSGDIVFARDGVQKAKIRVDNAVAGYNLGLETGTVWPRSGPPAGGTPVTVFGTAFQVGTVVKVGAALLTNKVLVNQNRITGNTPPGGAGQLVSVAAVSAGPQTPTPVFLYDFADVPATHQFYDFVTRMALNGVSAGCGFGNYCPNLVLDRKSLAVWLVVARYGLNYPLPPATGIFSDVPPSSPYAKFIEKLYNDGVSSGCGQPGNPLIFCPDSPMTREQVSVFLLRSEYGSTFVPPPCTTPTFSDVPCSSPFAIWIEELYRQGIAAGCSPSQFCPTQSLTRGQASVYLAAQFSLK
jgi:subtilisin family serine protease